MEHVRVSHRENFLTADDLDNHQMVVGQPFHMFATINDVKLTADKKNI